MRSPGPRRERIPSLRRLLVASSLSVACGSGSDATPQGEAKPEPAVARAAADDGSEAPEGGPASAPDEAAGPGVRPDGEIVSAVDWFHGTLEQALAQAKAEGKLVFMDVGAYWCPPCRRLDEEVFVRPEIGEHLRRGYVALHVDAEKGEGPELAERYRIQAFPTMVVLEPAGVEKGRIVDFLPADQLPRALDRIAAGGNVLAELEAAVEQEPDDLAKRYELGHAYLLAADAASAQPQLQAVLVGDPIDELGLASRVLYDQALLQTFKLEGRTEAAIGQFRELQRRFPDSKEAVRAYRHIGRLLHVLGREDEAVASLEAMVATDPRDPTLRSSFGWFSFRQRCRPDAGLAAVREGIALAPDDAELRYLEAELLHLLGQDEPALASIRQAAALEPKTAFYRRQVRRFEGLVEAGR
ncbi:MAG: thioredoxin family protein [Myxococcales bacterium]|nr:thioredoxin family protein [Myxococcales bacterium]